MQALAGQHLPDWEQCLFCSEFRSLTLCLSLDVFALVQAAGKADLSLCKQVMEVAAALRSGLYARAQALQLLRTPFLCEPLDLRLLNQATDTQAPETAGLVDAGFLGNYCMIH